LATNFLAFFLFFLSIWCNFPLFLLFQRRTPDGERTSKGIFPLKEKCGERQEPPQWKSSSLSLEVCNRLNDANWNFSWVCFFFLRSTSLVFHSRKVSSLFLSLLREKVWPAERKEQVDQQISNTSLYPFRRSNMKLSPLNNDDVCLNVSDFEGMRETARICGFSSFFYCLPCNFWPELLKLGYLDYLDILSNNLQQPPNFAMNAP